MSDTAPETPPGETPQQGSATRPAPILSGWRGAVAIGFATALIVFGVLVVTGPVWAPAVAPLFTGGGVPPADATLADRLAQLEAAQRDDRQKIDQAGAAAQKAAADATASAQQADRRITAFEAKQPIAPKPAASSDDIAELRQQLKGLEAKTAAAPADISAIGQKLQQLASANADLNNRIAALEKGEQAQSASDPSDTALLLAVLQIREALDTGRPFAPEYEALAALAKSHPDVAAAVAPFADAAKDGVATRIVLIERLRALRGAIATAQSKPTEDAWGARAWAQLRGLVTIRRIEGAGQSGPEAAVSSAERALASGDLGDAVAALEGLAGPTAEAARPWLQMARQRFAVEEAVHRVQAIVVARLGASR